jgi:uncharacterized membrane protein
VDGDETSGRAHGLNGERSTAMSTIVESVDVEVPVRTAYDQWTQFEEFPRFMDGVESVTQIDDTHLHWVAQIAGVKREWDAEITQQEPDMRIAWKATSGTDNAGVVTFHRLDDSVTRVHLQLDVEPEGAVEKVGDAMGVIKRQASGDLERFKELIEAQGRASGGWRGTVEQPGT